MLKQHAVHIMYARDVQTFDEPAIGAFSTEELAQKYIDEHHRDHPGVELRWQSIPLLGTAAHLPSSCELIYVVSDGGPSDTDNADDTTAVALAAFRSEDEAHRYTASGRKKYRVEEPRVRSFILDAL